MLNFSRDERALLGRLEHKNAFVYRQAEDFSLRIDGEYICCLNKNLCRDLIDRDALIELGYNKGLDANDEDFTDWVYVADPRLFAPNFEIE